jgi:hypothetical protein
MVSKILSPLYAKIDGQRISMVYSNSNNPFMPRGKPEFLGIGAFF